MNEDRGILLTGGLGLLGGALIAELNRIRRAYIAPSPEELDLRLSGVVEAWMKRTPPAAVINAAAYTDVVRAEEEDQQNEVWRLNRDAPRALARACAARGVPLIHVSTDFVFDGKKNGPYDENDAVAPLQVYGRSKLEGERAVFAELPTAVVVRTSTLFGPGRRERPHYVDAVLSRARRGARLELVRRPVSSPTYAPDLARALLDLVDVESAGVFHVVNGGECSRIELALEAMRLAGPDFAADVVERPEHPGGPPRPPYSVLNTSRFSAHCGRGIRSWQEALAEYIREHGPERPA
jgi:dTDP-4-dehydrorhamnose reductase